MKKLSEKKTQIEDISRNIYDIKNKGEYSYKSKKGITKEIVEEIKKTVYNIWLIFN